MQQTILSKPFLKHLRTGIIALIAFAGVLGLLEMGWQSLNIKTITVHTDRQYRVQGLEPYKNQNLFLLSETKLIAGIKNQNSIISDVMVKKQYPHTLIIETISREPIAQLKVSGGYYLLSKDTTIVLRSHIMQQSYPVINFYQQFPYENYEPGSSLGLIDLKTTLFFLSKADELQLPVESVDIQGINMIVFKLSKGEVYFSSEKDKNKQAYELEAISHQLKIEGKSYHILDLRFDKPVISF